MATDSLHFLLPALIGYLLLALFDFKIAAIITVMGVIAVLVVAGFGRLPLNPVHTSAVIYGIALYCGGGLAGFLTRDISKRKGVRYDVLIMLVILGSFVCYGFKK